jgi:hypothetical protein
MASLVGDEEEGCEEETELVEDEEEVDVDVDAKISEILVEGEVVE